MKNKFICKMVAVFITAVIAVCTAAPAFAAESGESFMMDSFEKEYPPTEGNSMMMDSREKYPSGEEAESNMLESNERTFNPDEEHTGESGEENKISDSFSLGYDTQWFQGTTALQRIINAQGISSSSGFDSTALPVFEFPSLTDMDNIGKVNEYWLTIQGTLEGYGEKKDFTIDTSALINEASLQEMFTSAFGDVTSAYDPTRFEIPESFDTQVFLKYGQSQRDSAYSSFKSSSLFDTVSMRTNISNVFSQASKPLSATLSCGSIQDFMSSSSDKLDSILSSEYSKSQAATNAQKVATWNSDSFQYADLMLTLRSGFNNSVSEYKENVEKRESEAAQQAWENKFSGYSLPELGENMTTADKKKFYESWKDGDTFSRAKVTEWENQYHPGFDEYEDPEAEEDAFVRRMLGID